jgi:hypothetical protein
MTEKLLPCPFCGSTSLEILPKDPGSEGNGWGAVQCVNLDCPTYDGFRSHGVRVGDGQDVSDERGSDAYKSQAIAAWNRRTPAPEGEVVAWVRPTELAELADPHHPRLELHIWGHRPWTGHVPLYASPVVPVSREEIASILAAAFEDHQRGAAAPGDGLFDFTAKRILAALGTKATYTRREG